MTFDDAAVLAGQYGAQTTPEQQLELYRAVTETPPGPVIEIGCHRGGTTAILLAAAETAGKSVHAVDPYPEDLEGKTWIGYQAGEMVAARAHFDRHLVESGRWPLLHVHRCDLSECWMELCGERFSCAFIDALHELDQVIRQVNLIAPIMTPAGRIYLHDMDWDRGQLHNTPETGVARMKGYQDARFDPIQIRAGMGLLIRRNP